MTAAGSFPVFPTEAEVVPSEVDPPSMRLAGDFGQ
jgi:hypothetical protein